MSRAAVDGAIGAAPSPLAGNKFRPDIEGLRAIAVGLVLLYHAFKQPFTGGFVGVDVFFVISGFLITSLLLREQEKTGTVSVAQFYARRVRRILPASTVAVVVTLFATYILLGFITGNATADDAKWTAIFAANIRFGIIGTDYLGSQMPPSPLQHMWSLGVEEQFYVVWPALFVGLTLLVWGQRHRIRLAVALLVIILASLSWSVIQTQSNATWAYFSPFTRAWELALGALIAVSIPAIAAIDRDWVYQAASAIGFVGIVASALLLDSSTPYPGWAVAMPVMSTGFLIAGGCGNPLTSVGRGLALKPMQWLGARSYSLYIWHWPVLIIPEQYVGHALSIWQNAGLVVLAVALSALTFRLVENPVRHSEFLSAHTWISLLFGSVLIAGTILTAQYMIATHYGTWNVLEQSGVMG